MRIHAAVSIVALTLSALALPVRTAAQKFQAPTKEELQMTSDPKAPGAPAVFLYREERIDNFNHYVSGYARIKVLTEKGKEWATVEIPYDPETDGMPIIEGRTIHSDGMVVPLIGKAEDLLNIKKYKDHKQIASFQLSGVEVGSVLEYKWTVPIADLISARIARARDHFTTSFGYARPVIFAKLPFWNVQQKIYVHKEHFFLNPFIIDTQLVHGDPPFPDGIADSGEPGYLVFNQSLPVGAEVVRSLKGDYTLDVDDVPAIQNEEFAPPKIDLAYYVEFYVKPQVPVDSFWKTSISLWSSLLNNYASESGGMKEVAAQITAGATTPEAKARKLYDAVQALDNTDYSLAKIEDVRKQFPAQVFKEAHDVWSKKRGSGDDLAGLYLALARAAGLSADGLQVANRDRRVFSPNIMSLRQLDDLLVVLHIDGKDIYLDPGEKFCPFGQLHWKHALTGGIQQNVKAPVYTPSNLTKDAVTARVAELTVDTQGAIGGTVKLLMNGPQALHYRQLNLTSGADEVKKALNESLVNLLPQGISGEISQIQGLDTPDNYLSIAVKVTGKLGTTTGKRLLLPAFFFSTGAHKEFVAEERRISAVDLHYAEQVIDDAVIHLPAGFTVESAPQSVQTPWEGHAQLIVKTTPGAGTVEIKRIFARAFILLNPKEYPELRAYYQKIATNDQQNLVLIQAASGN